MSDGLQSAAFSPTVCKWCSLAFIQGHKTCAQALKKWKSPRMRWKWDRTELLRFYSMNKFRWLVWQLVWVEVEQNRWVKPVQQNLCLPPNTEYPPHPKHTVPIPTAPFCADTEDEHVDINHCSSSTSQHPHPPAGPFCSCPPPSTASPVPAPSVAVDATAGSSWAGAGSHLGLTPLIFTLKRSERLGFACESTRYLPRGKSIQCLVLQTLSWSLQL